MIKRVTSSGFAIASALGLLVICAVLGVFFLKMFNLGQEDAARDASSERAYQAARAGSEYAAYQSLVLGNCAASLLSLSAFTDLTISLACQRTVALEAGSSVNVDTWTVIACSASSCPGALSSSYVERRMRLVIAK
jgi:MSHA biogenesis protein MshP